MNPLNPGGSKRPPKDTNILITQIIVPFFLPKKEMWRNSWGSRGNRQLHLDLDFDFKDSFLPFISQIFNSILLFYINS